MSQQIQSKFLRIFERQGKTYLNTATFRYPACVFLEAETDHGNLFPRHRVEKTLDDPPCEPVPLVVVQGNHLGPVVGHLGQVEALADVDQVEDVLLEARAAEADACLQEKF